MLPDIDSLALFIRVAELRSITKAADASYMSLAAASRRIALLEDQFKTPLFERSHHGVELTSAGNTALGHAKALLAQVKLMQADLAAHSQGRKGEVRILANTSAMVQFLPNDLALFYETYPDINLVIEERWSRDIIRAVLAAEAEIGIVIDTLTNYEGLDLHDYRSDRLVAVTTQGHLLSKFSDVSFEELLEHDLVGLEDECSLTSLLREQAAMLQKDIHLRVQVRSFEAVCRIVQAGLGVGLLPHQGAIELVKGMALSLIPIRASWTNISMKICVRSERISILNPVVKRVVEYLKSAGMHTSAPSSQGVAVD